MSQDASFLEFCKYAASKKEDPDALAELFVNFVEPFATEKGLEVPEEMLDALEEVYCNDSDEESIVSVTSGSESGSAGEIASDSE